MKLRPIPMTWTDDGHMVPDPRFAPLADKQFVIGESYPMEVVEERSMKNHNRYFAAIHTAFENLPEKYKARFPTEHSLRAKALVETHWCTERDHVCDTPKEARYWARNIRSYSAYSVIQISGNVIKVFTPRSQAKIGPNAMSPEDFKTSAEDVLNWIQALNPGLPLAAIKKEAAQVAPPEKTPKPAPKTTPNPAAERPLVRPEAPVGPTIAPDPESLTSVPLKPKTAPEYFTFARTWIMAAGSKDAAWRRWDGERELRDDLWVPIASRNALTGLIENIIQER